MKTKDIIKTLIILVMGIFVLSANINAQAQEDNEVNYDFGFRDLESALPDEASKELSEIGVSAENGTENLNPSNVFNKIWELLVENAPKPLSMLVSVIGVIILCTLIQSLQHGDNDVSAVFSAVSVLACSGIICTSFATLFSSAKVAVDGLSSFLSVYVPVFAGIMAAGGQGTAAASYCGIITVAAEFFCRLFSIVIYPLACCVMGISVAASFNPDLKISSIAESVKKLVNWVLAFVMTVFTGILSVQSFVGAATDSAAMRAVKFTVSGAIPIVGGAVSDALLTVKGSIGIIKASVGSFGIAASAFVMLPSVISLFLFRIVFTVTAAVSDCFGASEVKALLKSGENVLSIILAMIVSFWVLGVASTALMLVIGGGTA